MNDAIKSMSRKHMERSIYEILTDNGMSEEEADKTIDNMSVSDMEKYLSEMQDVLDESIEDND